MGALVTSTVMQVELEGSPGGDNLGKLWAGTMTKHTGGAVLDNFGLFLLLFSLSALRSI